MYVLFADIFCVLYIVGKRTEEKAKVKRRTRPGSEGL